MTARVGYAVAPHDSGCLISRIFATKGEAADLVRDLLHLDAQVDPDGSLAFCGTYVVVEVRS